MAPYVAEVGERTIGGVCRNPVLTTAYKSQDDSTKCPEGDRGVVGRAKPEWGPYSLRRVTR